jgi:bifunctional DNA-binding transcriptional regulator/antitoxin component of YhaV-PrlF toxin-antitoxin module
MHKVAKISSKGQITLPKAVRDRLGSNLVRLVSDEKASASSRCAM